MDHKTEIMNIVCEGCKKPWYPDYGKDDKGHHATVCDHCKVPRLLDVLIEAATEAREKWHNFK